MLLYYSSLLLLLLYVNAHMEMRLPPPRRSKYNSDYQALGDIDNDMPAPLGEDFPFPCRGTKPGPIYKKYIAGENMDITLGGNAPHNGGHCQFALSYDGGEKWVVFHTIVRNCMPSKTGPIEFKYQIPIPLDAPPSDNVVFSWNWINASGEREFYMNCIDIAIDGNPSSNGIKGKELLVVNLPDFPTIEEFGRPNSYDGHKLLDNRKNITMSKDGKITPTVENVNPLPLPQKPSESIKPNDAIKPVTVTVTSTVTITQSSKIQPSLTFIKNNYPLELTQENIEIARQQQINTDDLALPPNQATKVKNNIITTVEPLPSLVRVDNLVLKDRLTNHTKFNFST